MRARRRQNRGMSGIAELRNLGPKSSRWLASVGIETLDDLAAVGAVEAYRRCRDAGYPVSLNLLWALQGALLDLPWNQLPVEMKVQLRREADAPSR